MTPPSALRNSARVARRGITSVLTSAHNRLSRRGPETRTTPMPPRPVGVAIAAMTSFAMRRFRVLHGAGNLPLLRDRKDIIDQPIQHQTYRKPEKHDAKRYRHDLHDFRLHRIRRR